MLSQVLNTITTHALFQPGDRVLLGLSGGPDSTALLHGLLALAGKRLPLTIQAACVDHGLRAESAAEAEMVAARARAAGVPCEVIRVDVTAQRRTHVSLQDAARRARLSALQTCATRLGCVRIALGHTADDQAETVLFRIVRGTGLRGLAGIPYERNRLIRPLLDVRREDVLAFLLRRNLSFVTDPSNVDPRFARSRVRHEWLPFLTRENPRFSEALLRLSNEARRQNFPPSPYPQKAGAVIKRLMEVGQGSHRVSIPGGVVELQYGVVTPFAGAVVLGPDLPVPGPGRYPFAKQLVEIVLGGPLPNEPVAAVFDAEIVKFPLVLRYPQPGDRMRPRRGIGSRKLQDLFVDAKIPRYHRVQKVVLTDAGGQILWAQGLRPSEIGAPGPATRHHLTLRII